ncbi:MAG TPA: alanine--glyoxylate aminotransferase family protein [Kofleriaceae bacterium]|nr:alanine--glyoxylate aminotransferase family protein [Kofleriaceae bacterium]
MCNRAIVLAHRLVLEGGSELSEAQVERIRRTVQSLVAVGVREVCLVDGEHATELRERLVGAGLGDIEIEVIANRSWKTASGSALRLCREFLTRKDEPCLVVHGERPLPDSALAALSRARIEGAQAAACVAEPPDGDLSEEIKVRFSARGKITDIGLDLPRFDAVLTGHLLVMPAILDDLADLANPTLEDALARTARGNRLKVVKNRVAWLWNADRPAELSAEVDAILDAKRHPRRHLLNPGPVNTTARVKSALVHHDVCHRDPSFSELLVSLTGKLRRIFRASPEHSTLLITGSGTAAMECAITSAVPRDRKILVVDNGAFGERLCEIARVHDMELCHLRYAWGDEVRAADVRRALENDPDIAVVAMIHHETSVGLLNPVREVGAICRELGALLVVDAVSSLGAEDIDVVRDNIDICYASANKCLHAISGAGIVCVSPRVWPKIETIKPRSFYLDLKRYRRYMDELAQTPYTPAVSTYFALDAACSEVLADGLETRFEMYRRRNAKLRRGLADLGMAPFTRTGRESRSVVTACVPDGVTFEELYTELKGRGFIIYGCKEVLADKFLQVANMGDLDDATLDLFLEHCAEAIADIRLRHAPAVPMRASA